MSKCQLHFVLIQFFIATLFLGCTRLPPSDFYEVDGLVSGELTDSSSSPAWQSIHYINSEGLVFNPVDSIDAGPLMFTVYISTPGNYSLWVLTTSGENVDHISFLDITVTGPDGFLHSQVSAEIPEEPRLTWVMAGPDTSANLMSIEEPGQYSFSIRPRSSEKVQVHKIQMSRNNFDQPFGLGLPSSTRTDLSAADLFREIPVMLPPAWVFKPIIGVTGESDSLSEVTRDSISMYDQAGGMWIDVYPDGRLTGGSGWSTESGVVPGIRINLEENCAKDAAAILESGFRFIVTRTSPGIDCLERIHQAYQETHGNDHRSVLFQGIKNAYNPDLKQYPAPMTPGYKFEWTAEPKVQNGEFVPGGYEELVSDLSNPANSLYGMPFLSMPVDYQSRSDTQSDWDSELFIRTVQLSPFLPVMHLLLPGYLFDDDALSDEINQMEKEQLFDALQLRTSLFPYHYTHAHYTRQTNESVVSGFRQSPTQFMYGDAFLVAPVLEPNTDGRIVFFPEGRRWYNYHSGQIYEAGRSWFVDTRLDRLPLFVKAGSVIPYQVEEGSDLLKIEIYTGDAGAFRMVEDDGVTRAYRRAEAARTMFRYNEVEGNLVLTIGAVQAEFEAMTDRQSYDIHFKFVDEPERVEINGSELNRSSVISEDQNMSWQYNDSDRVIIVKLKNVSKHEKLDIIIYP